MNGRQTWTGVVVAVVTLWPAALSAQAYLLVRDRDGLRCDDAPTADCGIESCPETCGLIGPDGWGGQGCHYREHTALCCNIGDDCFVQDAEGRGILGSCLALPGLSTSGGSSVFGICDFASPGSMWCGLDPFVVWQCLPSTPTSDWGAGNCDLDGLDNEVDATWCPDAAMSDGGVVPWPDGSVPLDGSVVQPDGAVPRPGDDGAVPIGDGAIADANRPGDGAPPVSAPPGVSFRGGGGCVCRASPGRPLPEAWLAAWLAIAVGWGAHTRRR